MVGWGGVGWGGVELAGVVGWLGWRWGGWKSDRDGWGGVRSEEWSEGKTMAFAWYLRTSTHLRHGVLRSWVAEGRWSGDLRSMLRIRLAHSGV